MNIQYAFDKALKTPSIIYHVCVRKDDNSFFLDDWQDEHVCGEFEC